MPHNSLYLPLKERCNLPRILQATQLVRLMMLKVLLKILSMLLILPNRLSCKDSKPRKMHKDHNNTQRLQINLQL